MYQVNRIRPQWTNWEIDYSDDEEVLFEYIIHAITIIIIIIIIIIDIFTL
jgi:hypothetical protein